MNRTQVSQWREFRWPEKIRKINFLAHEKLIKKTSSSFFSAKSRFLAVQNRHRRHRHRRRRQWLNLQESEIADSVPDVTFKKSELKPKNEEKFEFPQSFVSRRRRFFVAFRNFVDSDGSAEHRPHRRRRPGQSLFPLLWMLSVLLWMRKMLLLLLL